MIKPKKLRDPTLKQKKFTIAVAKHGNATQAAKEAGYSKTSARQIGAKNMTKDVIKTEIQSAAEKLGITTEYVLNGFKKHKEFNEAEEEVTEGYGDNVRIVRRMRDASTALKANEMLGKHLKLFTDKIELEAKVETDARTPEAELELARQLVAILSDPTLKK